MSRRSSRLSGQLNISPPPANIDPLSGQLHYRTSSNAAAGPSSRSEQTTESAPEPSRATSSFEDWSLAALQAEVKRYGFKVSRKRSMLIDQLKAVHEALQRSQSTEVTSTVNDDRVDVDPLPTLKSAARTKRKLVLPNTPLTTSIDAAKGKGRGRPSDPFILDVSSDSDPASSPAPASFQPLDHEQAGDFTLQLELEALSATDGSPSIPSSPDIPLSTIVSPTKRRTRSRSQSLSSSPDIPLSALPAEEQEPAAEPTLALAQTMTTAIRSDPALWDRILKYEPISFDEFVSVATQNGLGMAAGKSKEELRTWLDRQCICFYSADLTGPRSRH